MTTLRRQVIKIRERIRSAWRHGPDWLELCLYFGLLSHAWRFSQVGHVLKRGDDAPGHALIVASDSFLLSHFNAPLVAVSLALIGLLGIVSWAEEWTAYRFLANTCGSGWWVTYGYVLCRHTPGHVAGVFFLGLWVWSLITWVFLYAQWDKERQAVGAAVSLRQTVVEETRVAFGK